MARRIVRYSEAFKLQVIDALESGRFSSANAVMRAYGVRGGDTLRKWATQYGKAHLINEAIRVEKPNEQTEVQRLRERIRKLESALSDAVIDKALEQAHFSILCEQEKIDGAAFKKKLGTKPYIKLGRPK